MDIGGRLAGWWASIAGRRKLAAGVIMGGAIIAAGAGYLVFKPGSGGRIGQIIRKAITQKTAADVEDGFEKLKIEQREEPFFKLAPTTASKYGVLPKETFTLTTKEAIGAEVVEKSLKSSDAFRVTAVSGKEFKLSPAGLLEKDKVVNISLAVKGLSVGSHVFDRNYGWSYQTQGKFRVTGTLPGDKKSGVPLNTGIEIIFSQDDFTDPTGLVSITPAVEFRTEIHGETLAIVPLKPLQPKTIYKVTLKKGVNLRSRNDPVGEETTFSFQTQDEQYQNREQPSLWLGDDFLQFTPREMPAVKIYTASWKDEAVRAEIYKFVSAEDFVGSRKNLDVAAGYWYRVFPDDDFVDVGKLVRVGVADVKPQKRDQVEYLGLPEPLAEGFYVVKMRWGENYSRVAWAWLQSTELAGFVSVGKEQTLVWANDLETKRPASGAKVTITGAAGEYYTSDTGVTVFPTPGNISQRIQRYVEITTTEGRRVLLPASGVEEEKNKTQDDYWTYLYHERRLYRPSDTVYFWGVVKERDTGAVPATVKVSLAKDYEGINAVGEAREAGVASDGTFFGNIKYEGLPVGWYSLIVKAGGVRVAYSSLEVQEILKPEMKIEVEADRKAMFAGDKAEFVARVSFFDGTPVRNVAVKVYEDRGGNSKEVNTDNRGEIRYVYESKYSQNHNDYPRYENVTFSPALAQQATVEGHGSVYVYGSKLMLTTQSSQDGARASLGIKVNRVNLADATAGPAVGGKETEIVVLKSWWDKIEKGTYYDFIEKVTRPSYEYVRREEKFAETKALTDSRGEAKYGFDMERQKSYTAVVKIKDEDGRLEESSQYYYYYDDNSSYQQRQTYPELTLDRKENTYSIGEPVNLVIKQGGNDYKTSESSRFLFVVARRGKQDFYVENSPKLSFSFESKHIPNAYAGAVIFTGTRYQTVTAGCEWSWYCYYDWGGYFFSGLEIRYKSEDSKLGVSVNTGEGKYKPGDEAKVAVEVRDKNGVVQVGAEVNLVLVDQALAAIGGVVNPSILTSLYRPVASYIYYQYHSHKPVFPDAPVAEKGGGGGDFRQIFKDTAIFARARTDDAGVAEFAVKLPDNLTTWIVYAQAVNSNLEAGQTEGKVVVSREFFVTSQFPREYLEKDRPALAVNSFGSGLGSDETVNYEVSFYQGEVEKKKSELKGRAFEEAELAFPRMEMGEYKIGVKGKAGSRQDGILLPFKVTGSRLNLEYGKKFELGAGQELKSLDLTDYNRSKPVELVITDIGMGRYYWTLRNYCWLTSNRLEKLVAKMKADQIIEKKFDENGCGSKETEKEKFQNEDGGLAQVWWGSSNLETTVWAVWIDKSGWNEVKLAEYLDKMAGQSSGGNKQKIYSWWGLTILGKPKVGALQLAAAGAGSFEEKIAAGLALASVGEIETARELYLDILADYAYINRPYIRIQRDGAGKEEVNKLLVDTASTLLLGSLVSPGYNEGMGAYLRDFGSQATDVVLDLGRLAFIESELTKLPEVETRISLTTAVKQMETNLTRQRFVLATLTPEEVDNFSVKTLAGKAEVRANFSVGSGALAKLPRDGRLRLQRSYKKVKGEGNIQPGDVVEVRLDFGFDGEAPLGGYSVIDHLPSGLSYLENPDIYGLRATGWGQMTGGNVLKYHAYNSPWWREPTVVYYARAAAAGTYVAEPAILQSNLDLGVFTSTPEESVNIGRQGL